MQHTRSFWYVNQVICIEIFLPSISSPLITNRKDTVLKRSICHFSFGHNAHHLIAYMGFLTLNVDGYTQYFHKFFKFNLFIYSFCSIKDLFVSACWHSIPSEVWAIYTCIYTATNTAIVIIPSKYTRHCCSARHSWVLSGVWVSSPKVYFYLFSCHHV